VQPCEECPFSSNHPSPRVLFLHRFKPRRAATGPASTAEVLMPARNTTVLIFFIVSVSKTSVKQLAPREAERTIRRINSYGPHTPTVLFSRLGETRVTAQSNPLRN